MALQESETLHFEQLAANLDVGKDVNIDVVWAGHQIDGGEKDVAGEELLRVCEIGMVFNVIN